MVSPAVAKGKRIMVTLQGGVTQAVNSNNVPLTGNVQQTVSPNSASAGGNVFNQTYAPDVTLVPRQPVNFVPTQPLSALAPLSNAAAIPGPQGSPINIPSTSQLQNAFASPTLQGSATRGAANSVIVGRNSYSPGQVSAQAYDPNYGGYAPPQQQPVFMQPPRAQYAMQPRPLIDPNTLQQLQQITPQVQRTPAMRNAQQGMWDAQAYARQAAELASAPIAPPLYMQNTRAGRLDRAMRNLTHGGQRQMLQGQTAYYNALSQQPQQMGQAANYMRQAYHDDLNYEKSIAEKNAEISARAIEKFIKQPTQQARQSAIDFMMKQWPNPSTNEEHRQARLRYAEDLWQNSDMDLSRYINEDSPYYAAMLKNKEYAGEKSWYAIEKSKATLPDQIQRIKDQAKITAANAEILTETKEYRKSIVKLSEQQKQIDLAISKELGSSLKKAQLEATKMQILKAKSDLQNETAKNYDKIDKSWNAAMGRYLQAINSMDDDAKSLALEELRSYGPPVKGTEKSFQVLMLDAKGMPVMDKNGIGRTRPVVIGIPQQVVDARKYLKDHAISQPNQNGFYAPPPAILDPNAIEAHPEYPDFAAAMSKKNNGKPPTQAQREWFAKQIAK